MKIESIQFIARVLEQRNDQIEKALPSLFEMHDGEKLIEQYQQDIEISKNILAELKHEVEMITKYGHNWVQHNPNMLNETKKTLKKH
jgi:hypothetical protein